MSPCRWGERGAGVALRPLRHGHGWKDNENDRGSDDDPAKLGWRYTVETGKKDSETYDTTLPGYGNGGHTFGDRYTPEQRKALLEYLKTL